jgi:hypothetical protein
MTRAGRGFCCVCGATCKSGNFSLFIADFYNLQTTEAYKKGGKDTDLNEKMKSEMRRKVREMMDR